MPNNLYLALDFVGKMAAKEFEVLALDGSNFPQWATYIKVNLSTRGLYKCLTPPGANDPPIPETIPETVKYGVIYFKKPYSPRLEV